VSTHGTRLIATEVPSLLNHIALAIVMVNGKTTFGRVRRASTGGGVWNQIKGVTHWRVSTWQEIAASNPVLHRIDTASGNAFRAARRN